MEVSALKQPSLPALRGPSPLLRLQPDERLIALTRRGNQGAFEALVSRYQSRLLAFCRHMLNSREDAEDVLQEVFAAAFNAIQADDRPINARPWLYRIARNRCLNHLRRNTAVGVDSMDVHFADAGQTTGEKVAKREEFRLLLQDIGRLPETQRTALLLREMEALSYQQISEVMDTTVPSVKSLLVRARVSLAEAAESRQLSCDEVRLELGAIAEGLTQETAPLRRHLKECDRCHAFRGQLRETSRALTAVLPVAPLLLFKGLALKKLLLAKLGSGAGAGGAGVSTATAGGASGAAGAASGAAGAAGLVGAGSGTGALTAGAGALATKAVAGLAAAAIVTAGAVEARHGNGQPPARHHATSAVAVAPAVPEAVQSGPRELTRSQEALTGGTAANGKHHAAKTKQEAKKKPPTVPVATVPVANKAPLPAAVHDPAAAPKPTTQQVSSTTVLPPQPQPQNSSSQTSSGSGSSSTNSTSSSQPSSGTTGPTGSSGDSSTGTTSGSDTTTQSSSGPSTSSSGSSSSAGSPPLEGTTPSA